MALHLNHRLYPTPTPPLTFCFLLPSRFTRIHHHHYLHSHGLSKPTSSFSLSAVPPSNPNTSLSSSFPFLHKPQEADEQENNKEPEPPAVFLPTLKEQDKAEAEEDNTKSVTRETPDEKDDFFTQPIRGFFNSRVSSQQSEPTMADAEESEITDLAWKTELEIGEMGGDSVDRVGISVEEILEIARNLPDDMTLGEVLGPYQGKLSERECVQVLGRMGQEEELTGCCLCFFEWMNLQEPSLVTTWAYSALFPVLGRPGMSDKLIVFFNNMPIAKEFKDVHVYNSAISALLSCGRYDDIWPLYERMDKNNVKPDNVTCSLMITVMRGKGNSAKDAWEFFKKLNSEGLKWSLDVMGALIKSFCVEGLKKEALIVQLEMEKRGIASNALIYNMIMDAYSESNQVEEAEGLFAEMKAKGIAPTTSTYNILMDAYSRRIQPEVIENLMLEMEEIGLQPDVKSFTCLISAYGQQKKMSDMAANAFMRMKRFGIKPTSDSYTALIHAFVVSRRLKEIDTAFQNMLREGVRPSIETYTALLDGFRRSGDTESLIRVWKMMIKEKVEGTRLTFNILVDGFAKQGQYNAARDVISEFVKIGFQPTVMTYNMLMNAYGRGGQENKLPQLLKEMAELNLKPDSFTYSTMIYAYVRVQDFKRAFYYHKKMVKSGQVPDAKSYQMLRTTLDDKLKTTNKRDKSAIMGITSSKMGWSKAKRKGKKGVLWKNKMKRTRTGGSDSVGH